MKFTKIIAGGVISAAVFAGCGVDKYTEQFKDSPRGATNDSPADILTFPDGFSNVASKCDGPNRVYVAFKGDANRASITVAVNDPRCSNRVGE